MQKLSEKPKNNKFNFYFPKESKGKYLFEGFVNQENYSTEEV